MEGKFNRGYSSNNSYNQRERRPRPVDSQTEITRFNNSPVLQIWGIDEQGKQVAETPMVSFGVMKAKEIVKHIEEIKQFIKDFDNSGRR